MPSRNQYSGNIFDILRGAFDFTTTDFDGDGDVGGGFVAGNYAEIDEVVDDTGADYVLDTRLRPLVWVAIEAVGQPCDIEALEKAFPTATLTEDITSSFSGQTDGTIAVGDTAFLRYDPTGGAIDLSVTPQSGGSANVEVVVH